VTDQSIQDVRARQYAVSMWRLSESLEGAEALFDQALSNALAAIVAHDYPDDLYRSDGKVKSAAGLLRVLEEHGIPGTDGTIMLPHEGPDQLWVTTPLDDEPVPNFTEVRVGALREAIDKTQAVRHARGKPSGPTLTEEHLAALAALDSHEALYVFSDEERDRDELRASREGAEEYARARAYVELLDADEWARRRAIDYNEIYGGWSPDGDRVEVQPCPACGVTALVAHVFDMYVDDVGVGTCMACSYRRTQDAADLEGLSELLWRQSESDP